MRDSNKKIRVLRKNMRVGSALKTPLLAMDIENDPDTGAFICAAVYGQIKRSTTRKGKRVFVYDFVRNKDHKKGIYFDKQDEFLNYLNGLRPEGVKQVPTKIIVFNASYDYWFIIGITNDAELLTNGGNIITGKLKNGIPIMDLTNLTRQGSLGDWINYLKMEEEHGIKKETLDNLETRVKSDAKATWLLGDYLQKFFVDELGIPLKLTIASAARYLYTLQNNEKTVNKKGEIVNFFKDYWKRGERDFYLSVMERAAYRGGRTECFIKGKEVNYSYDVNSMYLSVMQKELIPDPSSAKKMRDEDVKKLGTVLPENTLYIADVKIKVPNQYVAVLPVLDPETGKLIFPTGIFRASYASPELSYAIAECEVEILEIYSVITYNGKPYFKDYAEFIWKKRKEYKDKHNKGMDILIKYLGNTLYGGFGQRNKESYMGKLEDFEIEGDKPTNTKVARIQGVEYVTATWGKGEDSSHTFPCVPVFITSYSRVLLHKALQSNYQNLIYTDTDSMKLRKEATCVVIGEGLGEWGYEGKSVTEFYKPKMYGNKCKGVPKRAQKHVSVTEKNGMVWDGYKSEIFKNNIYAFERPYKMRESFRRGKGLTPAVWEVHIKDVSKEDNKRVWISDKHSIPHHIDVGGGEFIPQL